MQPSCGAAESDFHLFLECDQTAQLWRKLLPSWDQFFSSRPRWTHIACAINPTLQSDWKEYQQIISDSWLALQAMTLHFVWTYRNRRLYDQRPATPTVPALSVIYLVRTSGTFEDSVAIKTSAFVLQRCCVNSKRKNHSVDFLEAEYNWRGYDTEQ